MGVLIFSSWSWLWDLWKDIAITVMPGMGSESDPHGPGEVCIPAVMPSEM